MGGEDLPHVVDEIFISDYLVVCQHFHQHDGPVHYLQLRHVTGQVNPDGGPTLLVVSAAPKLLGVEVEAGLDPQGCGCCHQGPLLVLSGLTHGALPGGVGVTGTAGHVVLSSH